MQLMLTQDLRQFTSLYRALFGARKGYMLLFNLSQMQLLP